MRGLVQSFYTKVFFEDFVPGGRVVGRFEDCMLEVMFVHGY